MKIAAISDIHGNMEALESVMEDIKKNGCEKVFVLGDYAMAGPEPSAAVDWFIEKIEDPNFYMIQGNTDLMIADYTEKIYNEVKENAPVMAEALKDDFIRLSAQQKDFLKNLPANKTVEIDGVKFLLVHGSPRKNNENILPDTTMAEIEDMLHNIDANVILCGHTHMPCGFQTETRQTVVNVGSVGRPFTQNPKSCWLKITVNNGQCMFEHKFVTYNIDRAALKLRKRTFIGANKLANTLIDPKLRHF